MKQRALESPKMATKVEKKTKKDDLMINGHQETFILKGHLKIFDSLRQPTTTTTDDQSLKSSKSSKFENQEKNEMVMMKMKKVWDCESSLYDSYELKSFNRQLDSAISSSARSISMPHLPPPPPTETSKKQSPNKISRSLGKLIKSMFRQKQSNASFKASSHGVDMDKYYVVFDKTGSLTTIPESGESTEMVGSRINSLARKTTSERFTQSRLVDILSGMDWIARDDTGQFLCCGNHRSIRPVSRSRRDSFLNIFYPFPPTRSLKEVMNFMDEFFKHPLISATQRYLSPRVRRGWIVEEKDDALYLRIESTGLSKEEVKVALEHFMMVISEPGKEEKVYKTNEMKDAELTLMVPKIKFDLNDALWKVMDSI